MSNKKHTFINSAVLNERMRLWVAAIIILLAIAGCVKAPIEEVVEEPLSEPVVEVQEEIVEEPPEEVIEEPEETEEVVEEEPIEGQYEPDPVVKYSIQDFYTKYQNDVRNYDFTYNNNKYQVKGKLAKIELFRVLQNVYNAPYIDIVYLDRERRMAIGVCEGIGIQIKKQCLMRDTLNKQFAVPYIEFAIKFPDDWLKEFMNLYTAPADTPVLVTDRPTIHLKHITATRTAELYIDPSIGLPVVVIDNSKEYHYTHLAKNKVTDTFLIE